MPRRSLNAAAAGAWPPSRQQRQQQGQQQARIRSSTAAREGPEEGMRTMRTSRLGRPRAQRSTSVGGCWAMLRGGAATDGMSAAASKRGRAGWWVLVHTECCQWLLHGLLLKAHGLGIWPGKQSSGSLPTSAPAPAVCMSRLHQPQPLHPRAFAGGRASGGWTRISSMKTRAPPRRAQLPRRMVPSAHALGCASRASRLQPPPSPA